MKKFALITLLWFILFALYGCKTTKSVKESNSFIQRDTFVLVTRDSFEKVSFNFIHDTLHVFDSIRVIVDPEGNTLKEFHVKHEIQKLIVQMHDTVRVLVKDSTEKVSDTADNHSKEKIVQDNKRYYTLLCAFTLFVCMIGWITVKLIEKKKNG